MRIIDAVLVRTGPSAEFVGRMGEPRRLPWGNGGNGKRAGILRSAGERSFSQFRGRGAAGHGGSSVAKDHRMPFWYMRGWDPKLPYPAEVVRQSASLL